MWHALTTDPAIVLFLCGMIGGLILALLMVMLVPHGITIVECPTLPELRELFADCATGVDSPKGP